MKKQLIIFAFMLSLAACGDRDSTQSSKSEPKTSEQTPGTADLRNGITVQEHGLKVSKALLLHSDGSEIGNDNIVAIGEEILCRMFISGWQETEGRVKLGATQTAATADGTVVLEQPDLFASLESASAEDARVVTLNATVTESNEQTRDLTVNFKVWDKVSNADVTGSYSFHLK